MKKEEVFNFLKENYSQFASWTIWDDDLCSGMRWAHDKNIIRKMNQDFIFVGLNNSEADNPNGGHEWWDFHSNDTGIQSLAYALKDTIFWGCYITDVIKGVKKTESEEVIAYLDENPEVEKKNIKNFKKEISLFSDPIIIAFGKYAYDILIRNGFDKSKVFKVWHYSYASRLGIDRKKKYREDTLRKLKSLLT